MGNDSLITTFEHFIVGVTFTVVLLRRKVLYESGFDYWTGWDFGKNEQFCYLKI